MHSSCCSVVAFLLIACRVWTRFWGWWVGREGRVCRWWRRREEGSRWEGKSFSQARRHPGDCSRQLDVKLTNNWKEGREAEREEGRGWVRMALVF